MLWRLKMLIAGAGLLIAALAASWFGGRKAAQADAKVDSLEGNIKAHKVRERIEDAIDQDIDLATRARRIGIVRPGSE